MTMMKPAPRQAAVKVSPEGDRLITSDAYYLRMSKKDLVEAAVEFYLNGRREEKQAGMRDPLGQIDDSRAPRSRCGRVRPAGSWGGRRRGGGRLAIAGRARPALRCLRDPPPDRG